VPHRLRLVYALALRLIRDTAPQIFGTVTFPSSIFTR
jgi:hypothetical protein